MRRCTSQTFPFAAVFMLYSIYPSYYLRFQEKRILSTELPLATAITSVYLIIDVRDILPKVLAHELFESAYTGPVDVQHLSPPPPVPRAMEDGQEGRDMVPSGSCVILHERWSGSCCLRGCNYCQSSGGWGSIFLYDGCCVT